MWDLLKSWGAPGAFLLLFFVFVEFNMALKDLFGLESSPVEIIIEYNFGHEEKRGDKTIKTVLCGTDKLYRARNNCDDIAYIGSN